jgi:hypothetical protein
MRDREGGRDGDDDAVRLPALSLQKRVIYAHTLGVGVPSPDSLDTQDVR